MEKMKALKWTKETEYCTETVKYHLYLKGIDKENRDYCYRGHISKQTSVNQKGSTKNSYFAEYSLFEDGNNFKLRPEKGMNEFATLQEAKKWVETSFRDKWSRDHKEI